MPLDRLLPASLIRTTEESGGPTLYECRHCGSKFEDDPGQCPVCDATEIATYTFTHESSEE